MLPTSPSNPPRRINNPSPPVSHSAAGFAALQRLAGLLGLQEAKAHHPIASASSVSGHSNG